MGEEDIRNYLNQQVPTEAPRAIPVRRRPAQPRRQPKQETFESFSASHMFCATCRAAMPVRERILLFLPDGDLYDYQCTKCGSSTGTKKVGRR